VNNGVYIVYVLLMGTKMLLKKICVFVLFVPWIATSMNLSTVYSKASKDKRDLSFKILKTEEMKDLTINTLPPMGKRAMNLTIELIDELRQKKLLTKKKEEYNAIVVIVPSGIKERLDGECQVPADWGTSLNRFGSKVLFVGLAGTVLGGLIGGFTGANLENGAAQNSFNEKQKTVYAETYKQTINKLYPEKYKEIACMTIIEKGCMSDTLIDFTTNTVTGEDPGPIGLLFGKEMKKSWYFPWKAFNDASEIWCIDKYGKTIEELTKAAVEGIAEKAAIVAIDAVLKPVNSTISLDGAKVGALGGGIIGVTGGAVWSIASGDLSRPIACTEIKNMNQVI